MICVFECDADEEEYYPCDLKLNVEYYINFSEKKLFLKN